MTDQTGWALSAVLLLLILLLLAGLQVLSPVAVGILITVFAAFLIWRVRSGIPSDYRIAQQADLRLNRHDSISTAYFFQRNQEKLPAGSRAVLAHLSDHVNDEVEKVQPSDIFPIGLSRGYLAALFLATIAFGLFAYRYLAVDNLEFGNPTVAVNSPSSQNFTSQPAELL
jgi:hypothetical protein